MFIPDHALPKFLPIRRCCKEWMQCFGAGEGEGGGGGGGEEGVK